MNKNGGRNREIRNKQYAHVTGYYNMDLFIAMETFKSLPLAEVLIINHKTDLQFTE